MEKKLSLLSALCSAGALIAAAVALVLVLTRPAPTQTDANQVYRLEKLNEVNDMVLSRQIVSEDYLRYLPEELSAAVKQYNSDTAGLKQWYSSTAEDYAASILYDFDPAPERPGPYEESERYYQMVDRMSTLALFRNCADFYKLDPVLSFTVAHESGGSYGLWAGSFHESWYVGEELGQKAADYLDSVDALLDKLDEARAEG